jgi:hypothetical protein
MSSQPAIETICSTLNEGAERPRSQVTAIVEALGEVRAMALLAETQRIELSGGMLVPDGSRRRTPGGVFFVLARRALPPHERDRIFSDGRQHPPKPAVSPPAPAPAPVPAPAPTRATPPTNNVNAARRFENRAYPSSSSYSSGSSYGQGRTNTYTAHGSTRQTTVEFSSRLATQSAAHPASAPPPPPAPAPVPPKPPTISEGQRLVPLRRRIVSLPSLQSDAPKPNNAAETASGVPGESEGPGKKGRAGRRGREAAADSAANDTTPARPVSADVFRARTAISALSPEDRRALLLELVDELGSDRDASKPKFGLRDLVVSRLASALALQQEHWGRLLGIPNGERATEGTLPKLNPHQLERIDRFVTLLVDSLEPEGEVDSAPSANGAGASAGAESALSGVGSELEMRTRQFVTRLHTLVRSATLQSVQQAFSGSAARRSSSPPSPRRAARKPSRPSKRPAGRQKSKRRR